MKHCVRVKHWNSISVRLWPRVAPNLLAHNVEIMVVNRLPVFILFLQRLFIKNVAYHCFIFII